MSPSSITRISTPLMSRHTFSIAQASLMSDEDNIIRNHLLLSPHSTIKELCTPRDVPRPPLDVLNRSPLGNCSPSLAKYCRGSRTSTSTSTSTSTTALPDIFLTSRNNSNFLHPTMVSVPAANSVLGSTSKSPSSCTSPLLTVNGTSNVTRNKAIIIQHLTPGAFAVKRRLKTTPSQKRQQQR
ncbi:unnamed protein product [Didymodactylos carnosus]|uniref:Uncharacterized protein n=1 Tax=Didymodactylos carnosus TaxID=1234261 RepID=A0A814Y120_9BILA|nr:unnamed protein product [Didymodactylos carnosus]CAF1222810.1 unnamed protein product [Didymodactylos carnosus]CAF3785344.1 unnamed protein product [Didymodactylos carnosus]CAF3986028.1 unnamed protein product [Didymodactylos carnosus]